MKKITLLLTTLLSLFTLQLSAQMSTENADKNVTINGLKYGYVYTPEQVKDSLGNPTKEKQWTDEFGLGHRFEYGPNGKDLIIHFYDDIREDLGIYDIILGSDKFSLMYYGEKLKVGDSLGKLQKLPGFHCFEKIHGNVFSVIFNRIYDDTRLRFEHEKGFITKLYFVYEI